MSEENNFTFETVDPPEVDEVTFETVDPSGEEESFDFVSEPITLINSEEEIGKRRLDPALAPTFDSFRNRPPRGVMKILGDLTKATVTGGKRSVKALVDADAESKRKVLTGEQSQVGADLDNAKLLGETALNAIGESSVGLGRFGQDVYDYAKRKIIEEVSDDDPNELAAADLKLDEEAYIKELDRMEKDQALLMGYRELSSRYGVDPGELTYDDENFKAGDPIQFSRPPGLSSLTKSAGIVFDPAAVVPFGKVASGANAARVALAAKAADGGLAVRGASKLADTALATLQSPTGSALQAIGLPVKAVGDLGKKAVEKITGVPEQLYFELGQNARSAVKEMKMLGRNLYHIRRSANSNLQRAANLADVFVRYGGDIGALGLRPVASRLLRTKPAILSAVGGAVSDFGKFVADPKKGQRRLRETPMLSAISAESGVASSTLSALAKNSLNAGDVVIQGALVDGVLGAAAGGYEGFKEGLVTGAGVAGIVAPVGITVKSINDGKKLREGSVEDQRQAFGEEWVESRMTVDEAIEMLGRDEVNPGEVYSRGEWGTVVQAASTGHGVEVFDSYIGHADYMAAMNEARPGFFGPRSGPEDVPPVLYRSNPETGLREVVVNMEASFESSRASLLHGSAMLQAEGRLGPDGEPFSTKDYEDYLRKEYGLGPVDPLPEWDTLTRADRRVHGEMLGDPDAKVSYTQFKNELHDMSNEQRRALYNKIKANNTHKIPSWQTLISEGGGSTNPDRNPKIFEAIGYMFNEVAVQGLDSAMRGGDANVYDLRSLDLDLDSYLDSLMGRYREGLSKTGWRDKVEGTGNGSVADRFISDRKNYLARENGRERPTTYAEMTPEERMASNMINLSRLQETGEARKATPAQRQQQDLDQRNAIWNAIKNTRQEVGSRHGIRPNKARRPVGESPPVVEVVDPDKVDPADSDKYIYHITTESSYKSILKDQEFKVGPERPFEEDAGLGGGPGADENSIGRVFFTDAEGVKQWTSRLPRWNEKGSLKKKGGMVVLRVDRSVVEGRKSFEDDLGVSPGDVFFPESVKFKNPSKKASKGSKKTNISPSNLSGRSLSDQQLRAITNSDLITAQTRTTVSVFNGHLRSFHGQIKGKPVEPPSPLRISYVPAEASRVRKMNVLPYAMTMKSNALSSRVLDLNALHAKAADSSGGGGLVRDAIRLKQGDKLSTSRKAEVEAFIKDADAIRDLRLDRVARIIPGHKTLLQALDE